MGLKNTVKVSEIAGEPFRYRVESWNNPSEPHIVDLLSFGGHGACSCRDFQTTIQRNRKAHPNTFLFYGTPMNINPNRTQCRHIAACQRLLLMTVLPALARTHHKDASA